MKDKGGGWWTDQETTQTSTMQFAFHMNRSVCIPLLWIEFRITFLWVPKNFTASFPLIQNYNAVLIQKWMRILLTIFNTHTDIKKFGMNVLPPATTRTTKVDCYVCKACNLQTLLLCLTFLRRCY